MAQKGLTREKVVAEALRLLNEVGLDGLNLRRLAAGLEVKAPALYWHFSSKQDLMDEMATELWREVQAAGAVAPDTSWPYRMLSFALGLRRTLIAHRDGARLFSGTYLTDTSIFEAQEEPLSILVASGMSLDTAVEISNVLYAFTIGHTIEEQSVAQASEVDDRYDLEKRDERIDASRFPLIAEAGRLAFPEPEVRFEHSVRGLIAAFAGWERRSSVLDSYGASEIG
jgi:TetR/AcrR family tetracycline transcriptional repressor